MLTKERQDLLKYCKYYKGEEESPYEGKDQDKNMLWFYEMMWVNSVLKRQEESLKIYISEYIPMGLEHFGGDETKLSYKALLFNRYARGAYSLRDAVDGFKELYTKYYLSGDVPDEGKTSE